MASLRLTPSERQAQLLHPGKKILRFKCRHCGKLSTGRIPRAHGRFYGDGTIRYPRRHQFEGRPCIGNSDHASWVTLTPSGQVLEESD